MHSKHHHRVRVSLCELDQPKLDERRRREGQMIERGWKRMVVSTGRVRGISGSDGGEGSAPV